MPHASEAQLSVQQRFRIAKARSRRLLQRFDPSQPRDPDGKWGSGGGSRDSSGAAPTLEKPNDPNEVSDPTRVGTPEEQEAFSAELRAPQTVAEYEFYPAMVNYAHPFEDTRHADKFANEAEFKTIGGALQDYKSSTGDGDAYAVNRALRGKEEMTPRLQQAVDNIDLAFTKTAMPFKDYNSKQPKEAWVYRGIDNRHQLDVKVGDVVKDDAFQSATINKTFAQEWARNRGPGGTLVKITLPAGTKVVPLQDSSNQDEGELLINRGTQYTVTKVTGRNIEMRVIQ